MLGQVIVGQQEQTVAVEAEAKLVTQVDRAQDCLQEEMVDKEQALLMAVEGVETLKTVATVAQESTTKVAMVAMVFKAASTELLHIMQVVVVVLDIILLLQPQEGKVAEEIQAANKQPLHQGQQIQAAVEVHETAGIMQV